MYKKECMSTTQQAWLDIEQTLENQPNCEEAVACLKRVRHLLNLCIKAEQHSAAATDDNPT